MRAVPLILQAETYETAPAHPRAPGAAAAHTHGPGGGASADLSRTALTAVSNIVAAIAFALLLIAGFALRGGVTWRKGVLWGLGGFAAFSLAPSLGLPPELPGAFAAPVPDRQLWWALTVALTAAGLAMAAFAPGRGWKILGAALIALPHLIGAPQPAQHGGLAPEALAREFAAAALLASGLFWIALGGLSGYFFNRFESA
jgi:cobalt transporter subunit CbtA